MFHRNASELSFNYPQPDETAVLAKVKGKVEEEKPHHYTCIKTGEAHALFLKNLNVDLKKGDELGVFAKGLCVGTAKYRGELNDPLIIWSAVPEYDLVGANDGDKLQVRLWRSMSEEIEILAIEGDVVFSSDRVFSLIEISTSMRVDGVNLVSDLVPTEMGLRQNYPNPFNPTTTIELSLSEDADVNLMIYNIRGEIVKRLITGRYSAGIYRIEWDGRNENGLQVASGIYLYRIEAGSFIETRKMIFTK
ncbi:MAG: T9SS type A sorting domain-containing protein [Deltaproteobacteria bacterium]|nr:T9SS type A sorting domain-containing protein [Deltaproteobacteria bacterium]